MGLKNSFTKTDRRWLKYVGRMVYAMDFRFVGGKMVRRLMKTAGRKDFCMEHLAVGSSMVKSDMKRFFMTEN